MRAAVEALSRVPVDPAGFLVLQEAELLEMNGLAAKARQLAATLAAVLAGEIAHRSDPVLGSRGLAQKTGFRTPIEMVKATTGISGREAVATVRTGILMRDFAVVGAVDPQTGEPNAPTEPWLAPVAAALTEKRLSPAEAESIRSGLGTPTSAVSVAQLLAAAETLCALAGATDPDSLFRIARDSRDGLDSAGVVLRQEEQRQQRSFRVSVLPTGMGRAVWVMDPETLATVKDVYDRMTSPKLGGVRFVADDLKLRAEAIEGDARTPEQLASDGITQLLRLGADTDPRFMIGSGAPIVTIITTLDNLADRSGTSHIVGQGSAFGISAMERLRCEGDTYTLVLDPTGQPLDLGREQRLYTKRQRLALAIRDGGCRAPGCTRPPSWCEAHHITYWARDNGKTDIADGILLCKHHHLLFHNNGWQVRRDPDNTYWLIPPPGIDATQTPRPMPAESPAIRDFQNQSAQRQRQRQRQREPLHELEPLARVG
jgi:hypothetical protein